MDTTDDSNQPRFCSDCGFSLVRLEGWHTSSICSRCNKEIFYAHSGEEGGLKVRAGQTVQLPSEMHFSLDPKTGVMSRSYLKWFIKLLLLENGTFFEEPIQKNIMPLDDLVEIYKNKEVQIDKELNSLDCIQHCDLETDSGFIEALKILETEGLHEYRFNLWRSGFLRDCYMSIENGDALKAAHAAHYATMFNAFSKLENQHLEEIIWLGYECYVDLSKNEGLTRESAKEQRLIKRALPKIAGIETEFLYVLANDGNNIGTRLGLTGIAESTLKSLLQHELDRRTKDKEKYFKNREIAIKEKDNQLKIWAIFVTLVNAVIFAIGRGWIG